MSTFIPREAPVSPTMASSFNFMGLPREVRKLVYECYYQQDTGIWWGDMHTKWKWFDPSPELKNVNDDMRKEVKRWGHHCQFKRNTFIFDWKTDTWSTFYALDNKKKNMLQNIEFVNLRKQTEDPTKLDIYGEPLQNLHEIPMLRHFTIQVESIDNLPGPRAADWMSTDQAVRDARYDSMLPQIEPRLPQLVRYEPKRGLTAGVQMTLAASILDKDAPDPPDGAPKVKVRVTYRLEDAGEGKGVWKKVSTEEEHNGYEGREAGTDLRWA